MKLNKFRTFIYILRQSLYNVLRNKMMLLASLVIMIATMFIFGIFYSLSKNVDFQIENIIEKEYEISAYLDPSITDDEAVNFEKILKNDRRIERYEKISKIDAYEDFKSNYPEEEFEFIFRDADKEFLSVSFKIKLKDVNDTTKVVNDLLKYSIDDIKGIEQSENETDEEENADETDEEQEENLNDENLTDEISNGQKDAIWDITEIDSLIKNIERFSRIINIIFAVILGLLVFYSILVISNTVMLTVMARKREIEIMRNIGATSAYIRWPFIIEGIIIGLVGATIAFFISETAYNALTEKLVEQLSGNSLLDIKLLDYNLIKYELLLYFMSFSTFIGAIGAIVSVNKHIKN